MSVTLIQCNVCGFGLCYCQCKEVPWASNAIRTLQAERASLQARIKELEEALGAFPRARQLNEGGLVPNSLFLRAEQLVPDAARLVNWPGMPLPKEP